MALFEKKFRILHILLSLVLALVYFSFSGSGFRRAPWYEEAFWLMLTPPQRLMTAISSAVGGTWHHYVGLIGVQRENDELKRELAALSTEVIRHQETDEENKRLRSLLSYRESFPQKTMVARVIANDPRAEFKSIVINRGTSDGVGVLMPVVGPKGLVGKVGKVTSQDARVMLITDPNSSVDVMVQRSRARGMIVGAAWHTEMKAGYYLTRLEYLRGVSDMHDGDVIVTSGLDGVFPAGIPVGTVTDLRMSRYGVFREANIVPFENVAELQEVLVILNRTDAPREEQQETISPVGGNSGSRKMNGGAKTSSPKSHPASGGTQIPVPPADPVPAPLPELVPDPAPVPVPTRDTTPSE